MRDLPIAVL